MSLSISCARSWHLILGSLFISASSAQPQGAFQGAARPLPAPVRLDTSIKASIQIDQIVGGPGDANLTTGADPADGTTSVDFPVRGKQPAVDWDDLAGDLADHQLLDVDDPELGKDTSGFPRGDECIGQRRVPASTDLTYVAAASNDRFAYLAVQRAANDDDATYAWLFTRTPPRAIAGQAPCAAGRNRLVYDLSGPSGDGGAAGDLLVVGRMDRASGPMVRVFRATTSEAGVAATEATDPTHPTWRELNGAVAAAAINTTATAPGTFGAVGVRSMLGKNLGPRLLTETALDVALFTGGATCGATWYASVVTRGAGSADQPAKLEDLVSPAQLEIGPRAAGRCPAAAAVAR